MQEMAKAAQVPGAAPDVRLHEAVGNMAARALAA
jgi:hypothetical protein